MALCYAKRKKKKALGTKALFNECLNHFVVRISNILTKLEDTIRNE